MQIGNEVPDLWSASGEEPGKIIALPDGQNSCEAVNPLPRKYSTLPKFGNDVCVAHPGSILRGDHEVVVFASRGLRWTRQRRHERCGQGG